MEILVDTVNLEQIRRCNEILPLSGVTSNPTIIKKEGKIDFFNHLRKIRKIIGKNKALHVQVVGATVDEMLADAHRIAAEIDRDVYLKIPTDEKGLTAIKVLKNEGLRVTATAIYTVFQGELAMAAQADYLAPYYNRMQNMNISADHVITELAQVIKTSTSQTKILAASFHNVGQVTDAIKNGAQAVTIGPDVIDTGLNVPLIAEAVSDFKNDWAELYGDETIATLK
ncbi:transaldolase [Liquorilactobacillus sucicola DSM 21376 = JCM 15457]|uniref:Fructose-6-phosphate aldolase n=1 Tax=Liquorilactobacillus sucicola DSM 21376 = JCM 15457 TaxID=1423806 RepID=A0A023CWE8_9LACO|nr:fructose-6-phosphate aldolase [Liquorilactobacillus sucicola]KRN06238.1 fructose-6-phosphate aldolase [Liquorilactobacillus sucicola DSM 21376 = JCM 15457]GAJ26172.1 transaldolase [Liquorilactobacillus sucicola DSM 21376 = JCM 15457]